MVQVIVIILAGIAGVMMKLY